MLRALGTWRFRCKPTCEFARLADRVKPRPSGRFPRALRFLARRRAGFRRRDAFAARPEQSVSPWPGRKGRGRATRPRPGTPRLAPRATAPHGFGSPRLSAAFGGGEAGPHRGHRLAAVVAGLTARAAALGHPPAASSPNLPPPSAPPPSCRASTRRTTPPTSANSAGCAT